MRIDKIQGQPVVGRFYMVPCLLIGYPFGQEWYPIIGPQHDDTEYIGISARHWHYDVRFLTARQLKRLVYNDAGTPSAMLRLIGEKMLDASCREPVLKRKRFARAMPDFPLACGKQPSPFAHKLEDAYANVTLKLDCSVCPHRGIPLTGLPSNDGVVVCPGHGLAWDLNSGRMVRRQMPTPAGSAVGR